MRVEKHIYKKDYIWNPAICSCKNGKYLASITDDSAITCNEIIEERKTVATILNEKKMQSVKHKTFLLITIVLLIAVSTYCYLVKHYHFTSQITN